MSTRLCRDMRYDPSTQFECRHFRYAHKIQDSDHWRMQCGIWVTFSMFLAIGIYRHSRHGLHSEFSPVGIKIAVDYFLNRGHTRVYALLPRHRQPYGGTLFAQLELADHLKYTPSRIINRVRETPYDGRFILDAAIATDGIVLSNGQYRDLMTTEKYQDVISKRWLVVLRFGANSGIRDISQGRSLYDDGCGGVRRSCNNGSSFWG